MHPFSLVLVAISLLPAALASQIQAVACLRAHNVPFQTRSESFGIMSPRDWTTLTTPYNLRVSWEPSIVTLPRTSEHVSNSVICAAAAGIKIQAKSGGHSYASYSNGGQPGSLIVNLQHFNESHIDKNGVAKVGAGVRLGNLAVWLYDHGKRALPHGVCPGVGVGGHFTHGGYGYAARLWGLAIDSIAGLDVVLANGTFIYANRTQYPDIFYAMRGAADSIGIATNFYLLTKQAPSSILTFTAKIPDMLQDSSVAANAFVQLQKKVVDPKYINTNISFSIYTNNQGTFTIRGWCIECQRSHFEKITFTKLFEDFPSPASTTFTEMGWIDSLRRLGDGVPLVLPSHDYKFHDTFYSKSVVTKMSKPLTHGQWKAFWSYVITYGKEAPSPWNTIIDLYGGVGSQINAISKDDSAFSHRDSMWVIQNNANTKDHKPPFAHTIIDFVTDLTASIMENRPSDYGIYLNCVDPNLTAAEVASRGYGPRTYNRLLNIKKKVDPYFVFWNPHAVGNVGALLELDQSLQRLELRTKLHQEITTEKSLGDLHTELRRSTENMVSTRKSMTLPYNVISVDGLCGPVNNRTCEGSAFGQCCHRYTNECNRMDGPDHTSTCGTYCMPAWGSCPVYDMLPDKPAPGFNYSIYGRCGPQNSEHCMHSGYGNCCNGQYGICTDHTILCLPEFGCRTEYGWCNLSHPTVPRTGSWESDEKYPVSKDGNCGGEKRQHCKWSTFGNSCSKDNRCEWDSSIPGCQAEFGDCDTRPNDASLILTNSFVRQTDEHAFHSTTRDANYPVSVDGKCGSDKDPHQCMYSKFGNCCSQYGFCGDTTKHCAASFGCRREFGWCFSEDEDDDNA